MTSKISSSVNNPSNAGIATLPASLVFGALYQTYGPLVAFGSGAGFALLAAILLARL